MIIIKVAETLRIGCSSPPQGLKVLPNARVLEAVMGVMAVPVEGEKSRSIRFGIIIEQWQVAPNNG